VAFTWMEISRASESYSSRAEAAGDWPKPEPIEDGLPPVQAFSEDLLPESSRPLISDTADRMQAAVDFPAAVLVLSLAGVVNRRAVIQPRPNDTGWVRNVDSSASNEFIPD
jgi:hypothetical protein